MATLMYKKGTATGVIELFNTLDNLLTSSFSSTEPRGLGWAKFYSYSSTDNLYFSTGSSQSERIFLRLAVNLSDGYIQRQICTTARKSDGYMSNIIGGDGYTNINTSLTEYIYFIVGNKDFFHLVLFIDPDYTHYYSGLINRFAPNQNSSIYGTSAPLPTNTTVPASSPFTISSNTTLYLRTGTDAYGGIGSTNICFIPGQLLYIIDQSIDTITQGNYGVVVFNSANVVNNTINVSYVSGADTFSSFAIIGVDPQPMTLNTNGAIRENPFLMLDDFIGDLEPQFNAVNEFPAVSGVPSEDIQDPNIRKVFISYPIRLFNTEEIRGTLYGSIDVPVGIQEPQDTFITFDQRFKFINFPDGYTNIAIGSII